MNWALHIFHFIENRLQFWAKTPETQSTLRSWHVLVPRHLSSFPWHLVANPLDLTSLLFVFLHSVIYLLVMRSETLSGDSGNQPTFGVAENMPFPPQDSAVLRFFGCYFFFVLGEFVVGNDVEADVKTGPHMWMFFHVTTKWELIIKAVTAFKLLHVNLKIGQISSKLVYFCLKTRVKAHTVY